MLLVIITFLSTFFSLFHMICAIKYNIPTYSYKKAQKGISILIPCYNEAPILKYTIEGLKKLDYENYEVIFINDGSGDNTLEILNEQLHLKKINDVDTATLSGDARGMYESTIYANVYVIDKENSGKAESLNTGIMVSKGELVLTLDADCILKQDALEIMNNTFADKKVIASGGAVHTMQMFKLNNRLKLLVLLQSLDYIKGFYIYKASLAYNNALAIISGAFGIFKRDVLLEIGGFRAGLGEDIDITIRLQEYAVKNDKKVIFNENAICFTECPESFRDLVKQRVRWQKGFIDSIVKNRVFIFKSLLKHNLSFFLLIDAVLVNTISIGVLLINLLLASINIINDLNNYLISYLVITAIFNYVYSITAINKSKRYIEGLQKKWFYTAIIIDMFAFRFLYILFYIIGSFQYYFSNKSWNKFTRTDNIYNT
jgi:poly-beta-1,6-N-acetyl-D-glucosamine synthase